MCGIAGIFSLSGKPIANAEGRVRKMLSLLKHRGPDSQGIYLSSDGLCALGNTRLAIVDPHSSLVQPLPTMDGKWVLNFNGEIYNYLELRGWLQEKGVRFRSKTDTEVLLEGLRLEGEGFLGRLDGMWAFAYYDVVQQRLLLSRDLLGERHLFYREEGEELIFASEIKPLLADGTSSWEIDFESFLTAFRYFAPAPGRTMVKGICRMRPGHHIVAEAGKKIGEYRYRKISVARWIDFFQADPSREQAADVLEGLLFQACQNRIPRDVPFYSSLSSGLDSSLLCLYLSDFGKNKIKAITGRLSETWQKNLSGKICEYESSAKIAQRLNAEHHFVYLDCLHTVSFLQDLSSNAFDGMFSDSAAPYHSLARRVQEQNTKVLFLGDGADELLGYPTDQKAFKAQPALPSLDRFCFSPLNEYAGAARLPEWLVEPYPIPNVYGVLDPAYHDLAGHLDFSQMCALSYASLSLPDFFNLRNDKASMGVSVESRLPFQAPSLVEFLVAMPYRFRYAADRAESTKYLLRELVEKHIDLEIAKKPKQGFSPPLWKSPHIFSLLKVEETLQDSRLDRNFPFKKGFLTNLLDPPHQDLLWSFYCLAQTHANLKEKNHF